MRVSRLPLFLVYFVFPVTMMASRAFSLSVPRNWIDVAWAILFVFSASVLVYRRIIFPGKLRLGIVIVAVFFFYAAIKACYSYVIGGYEAAPFIMAVKPVYYLFVALTWVLSFGPPKRSDFVKFGICLSFLIILELLYEWIVLGSITRPLGSGEINYDALLILISWIFMVSTEKYWNQVKFIFLTLGLLACFSRTALVGAALALLIGRNTPVFVRVSVVTLSTLAIVTSFALRGLPINSLERADRVWMWVSAYELFHENPLAIVTGFPLGQSLDAVPPENVVGLWNMQAMSWGLDGVFSFNYHSFWLRASIDWGMILVVIMLCFLLWVVVNTKRDIAARRLALVIVLSGVTMGVFYLSNVAMPLILALVCLTNRKFDVNIRDLLPKNCVDRYKEIVMPR